jgi:hypothetical protein
MPAIVIVLIILALAITSVVNFLKPESTELPPEETVPRIEESIPESLSPIWTPEESKPVIQPQEEKSPTSSASIDTFIKYGPLEKEIIEDTNRVVFEFGAKVSAEETEGQISFETKIEGVDPDWQETFSNEREIDLPRGVGEYTFLVRAKINNIVDPTPAKRTFKIKVSPYFEKVKISNLKTPLFMNLL